jgi:hypothetical protein
MRSPVRAEDDEEARIGTGFAHALLLGHGRGLMV